MGRFSESEKVELWDRYEAGESLRSISRRLGRARRRCGPMSWLPGGGVRFLPGIGVCCGCRLGSVRRFRAGSLEASRCDVLPDGWVARRRRCHVKWLATVAGRHIGLRERIGRRGAGRTGRSRPSSLRIRA